MARFASEALDLTLRARAPADRRRRRRAPAVRAREAAERCATRSRTLLDRRHVALPAVGAFVKRHVRLGSAREDAGAAFVDRRAADRSPSRRPSRGAPRRRAVRVAGVRLAARRSRAPRRRFPIDDPRAVQQLRRRLERYFLTQRGRAAPAADASRSRTRSRRRRRAHGAMRRRSSALAPGDRGGARRARPRTSTACSRAGCCACSMIAVRDSTSALLDEHALLDFAGMLERAVALLERQEEFARSRLKLQSRYHHVLVDEFQDTSRAQWRLVELLIDAWGEGEGVADAPTSIFIVGDRKQSIYRFRHAEATLLDEAAREDRGASTRDGRSRQAITHSFRAVPELLAFVNALAGDDARATAELEERFRVRRRGSLSVRRASARARGATAQPVLGLIAEPSMRALRAGRGRGDRAAARDGRRARPHGARAARAARRHRDSVSRARRPPVLRRRARGARRSARTSTKAWDSSTRRKCRTCRRSCATWRSRTRTCARRSSCGRASCGCPTSALARAGAALRARAPCAGRSIAAARGLDRSRSRACSSARATASPAGSRSPIA